MSDPQISLNQLPSEPSLKDLMDAVKKDIFLSLNCHHLGTIQSFNSATQTATATINYKKTVFQLNRSTGLYDGVLVDYPILIDCPVIFLGGGSSFLTFPIAVGDGCLVLFNDRDIDNWYQGSSTSGCATSRAHSMSDGIIVVGLRSKAASLEDFDTDRPVLQNETAKVALGSSLIEISNDVTDLKAVLQDLISAVNGLASVIATGIPIVAPPATPYEIAIAAAGAIAVGSLAAVNTLVGELLE